MEIGGINGEVQRTFVIAVADHLDRKEDKYMCVLTLCKLKLEG